MLNKPDLLTSEIMGYIAGGGLFRGLALEISCTRLNGKSS